MRRSVNSCSLGAENLLTRLPIRALCLVSCTRAFVYAVVAASYIRFRRQDVRAPARSVSFPRRKRFQLLRGRVRRRGEEREGEMERASGWKRPPIHHHSAASPTARSRIMACTRYAERRSLWSRCDCECPQSLRMSLNIPADGVLAFDKEIRALITSPQFNPFQSPSPVGTTPTS